MKFVLLVISTVLENLVYENLIGFGMERYSWLKEGYLFLSLPPRIFSSVVSYHEVTYWNCVLSLLTNSATIIIWRGKLSPSLLVSVMFDCQNNFLNFQSWSNKQNSKSVWKNTVRRFIVLCLLNIWKYLFDIY